MKITRYVNGKKVNNALSEGIVIENELITDTIERISRRIQAESNQRKKSVNE